jgi:hypothetical protein
MEGVARLFRNVQDGLGLEVSCGPRDAAHDQAAVDWGGLTVGFGEVSGSERGRARCQVCLPPRGDVGGRRCGGPLPLPWCQGRGLAAQADASIWLRAASALADPTSVLAARRPSIL